MIVVDAGAWAMSLLDGTEVGVRVRDALDLDRDWAAPTHAPLEVLRTLNRFERAGHLTRRQADVLVGHVMARPVRFGAARPEVLRWVWVQRNNLSVYDAPYVHLAVELAASLVTLDQKLARAARALGVTAVVPGEDS